MSTLTIPQQALAIARGEVGYIEGPRNWTKYARDQWPDVQNQAWCGSFVGWCFLQAGFDMRGKVWIPYVPYIVAWAKKIGAWTTDAGSQKDGDLVVFNWGGRGAVDHVGIVYRDEKSKLYRSVEGNTSPTNAGSQGNGGGVWIRHRKRADIAGWVRMDKVLAHYGIVAKVVEKVKDTANKIPALTTPKPKPKPKAPVFPLPRKPGALYYYGPASGPRTSVSGLTRNTAVPKDVTRDAHGKWRSKGLYAWQKQMKQRGWTEITVDGKYSPNTEKIAKQFQKSKGLKVDGLIGPGTWDAAWTEPVT